MHTKPICAAVEQDNQTDRAILDLLLLDARGPVADAEIARELGDELAATDGLVRLERHGLIHRHAGFVFPTLTWTRAAALAQDR